MNLFDKYPPPWEARPREDGLINVYCGEHALALCVDPALADAILFMANCGSEEAYEDDEDADSEIPA